MKEHEKRWGEHKKRVSKEHWDTVKALYDSGSVQSIIINGYAYYLIGGDEGRVMGGVRPSPYIHIIAGPNKGGVIPLDERSGHVLRCNGEIPEEYRASMPDNARFIGVDEATELLL